MKIKPLLIIAIVGILIGIISAIIYNEKATPLPPVAVSYNPYEAGIYATGIVESFQINGSNVNIYPEVAGKVTNIFLNNGQVIKKGTPILTIDDSVQREIVAKDQAQIQYAIASFIELTKQLDKTQKAYSLNPKSVSINSLDNAIYAVKTAEANVSVAKAQYQSDKALLDKYIVRSPINGMILRIVSAIGDYASPQGSYDTYTQGMLPTVQMGVVTPYLQVRSFVDEILVPKLPAPSKLEATMFIRGLNNKSIPLKFSSIQPYTIPNIELSDQRNERVDVRVLPIIFKFNKPTDINIFPGQLVDVFIKGKA
jgi:HlyD family secretion protein